jgi:putative transposase
MEDITATSASRPFPDQDRYDPLERTVRAHTRGFIEAMLEAVLQSRRYDRHGPVRGHRHGHRQYQLIGTFGPVSV